MSNVTAQMTPQHLNGVEPGTVGGQVQNHQPSISFFEHFIDLWSLVCVDVIPDQVDRSVRVLGHQGSQELSHLNPSFALAHQEDNLTSVIVHRTDAILVPGRAGCEYHDLTPDPAPHGTQGGSPTQIDLIAIVEDLLCLQVISNCFNRRFFSAYSGSGLLILC